MNLKPYLSLFSVEIDGQRVISTRSKHGYSFEPGTWFIVRNIENCIYKIDRCVIYDIENDVVKSYEGRKYDPYFCTPILQIEAANKTHDEELFDALLDICVFDLVEYPFCNFGLYDRQCGNLGNIESDRFKEADDIIDRLDVYINDCIAADIEEELEIENYEDYADLVRIAREKDRWSNYALEIDILEMVCKGHREIDLKNCLRRFG